MEGTAAAVEREERAGSGRTRSRWIDATPIGSQPVCPPRSHLKG
jgi:hypothetical protein